MFLYDACWEINLAAIMNTKTKIFLQAIVASAALVTLPAAIAKGVTKASCIEAVYKSAASKSLNLRGEAVTIDAYCTCVVDNQYKLSQKTVDSYCADIAHSSKPNKPVAITKDPAADWAKMLLIKQMMAPDPMQRAVDQLIYNSILGY